MDRAKTKSRAPRIIRRVVIPAVALLAIGGGVTLANIDFSTHRVDRGKLSIETVKQGTMEIKVSANGQLLSKDIEEVVAQVPGRVAKKDIKPGDVVKVGQVMVELTNPDLVANAEQAQLAWESAEPELQSTEADLQINILTQEGVIAQAQLYLEKARLRRDNERALATAGVIPEMQLKNSELDEEQLKETYAIQLSRLQKLRDSHQDQLAIHKFHAAELARAFDLIKTQAADLNVLAGISGIVQAIDVEVGQQLQPGSPIGSIAQQDKLYAELKVPAREAGQVQSGQNVIVDTRNGTVNGIVTRVAPGVTDGTVAVDVDLQGALPAGARPQLQIEGIIYISRLPNTLYVGTPSYVKNDAAITVYKLDPAGRYATRVKIQAGKVSLNYMQVLQGLSAGDRIITSEIGEFQDEDRVLLN
jgi:HlyD family secretion protein